MFLLLHFFFLLCTEKWFTFSLELRELELRVTPISRADPDNSVQIFIFSLKRYFTLFYFVCLCIFREGEFLVFYFFSSSITYVFFYCFSILILFFFKRIFRLFSLWGVEIFSFFLFVFLCVFPPAKFFLAFALSNGTSYTIFFYNIFFFL